MAKVLYRSAGRDMRNVNSIAHGRRRSHDSNARVALVRYALNAGNYLVAAAGYSLLTEIYYVSQVLVVCHVRATFDILAPKWGSEETLKTTTTSS